MKEVLSLLPSCSPFSFGPLLAGLLVAVVVRFRNQFFDLLLSFKDGTYSSRELAAVLSLPLYASGVVLSSFVPVDIGYYLVVLTALYLVVDGLVEYLLGKYNIRPLSLGPVLVSSFFQGLFLPDRSAFSFFVPSLLARNHPWRDVVFLGFVLSLAYLSRGVLYLSPASAVPAVLGFVIGLVLTSLYYHAEELIPKHFIKPLYGVTTLVICFLSV